MASRRFESSSDQLKLFTVAANSSDIRGKQARDFMTWGVHNISHSVAKTRIQHSHNGVFINVGTQAGASISTYHDNDILIFLTSHLVDAINRGEQTSRRIFFTAHEFWRFANRDGASGARYEDIWKSLYRLNDSFVETNITLSDGSCIDSRWNWLSRIQRKTTRTGRNLGFTVDLADAIYSSIIGQNMNVLTIDRRYFSLRSGFKKWLYLYARKTAGIRGSWEATERHLYERSGSSQEFSQFRKMLKGVLDEGTIADYSLRRAFIGIDKAVSFERNKFSANTGLRTTIIME